MMKLKTQIYPKYIPFIDLSNLLGSKQRKGISQQRKVLHKIDIKEVNFIIVGYLAPTRNPRIKSFLYLIDI